MSAVSSRARRGERRLIYKTAIAIQSESRLPLHFAAERRSLRAYGCVHQLLRAFSYGRRAETRSRQLPLHMAVRAGNVAVMQLLLFRNADVQVRRADANGDTPLHYAARKSLDASAERRRSNARDCRRRGGARDRGGEFCLLYIAIL